MLSNNSLYTLIQRLSRSGSGGAAWGDITGNLSDQVDLDAALDALAAGILGKVGLTGDEDIDGVKTFLLSPKVPTPDADDEAANKGYVDEFSSRLLAVEFNGNPQTVEFGKFYPDMDVPIGDCFYECWIKLLAGASSGKYDWSAGWGGAHAMLRNPYNGNFTRCSVITNATNATPIVVTTQFAHGLSTGAASFIRGVLGNTAANVENPTITVLSATTFSIDGSVGNGAYTNGGIVAGPFGAFGTGLVEFGGDDIPYVDQWAHSATGVYIDPATGAGMAVTYYDGVPVGVKDFIGQRFCGNIPGSPQVGFMGGSDHSNLIARLSQYRIFEGGNPHAANIVNPTIPLSSFVPQIGFGNEQGNVQCNLLVDFFQPQQIVADKSHGLPVGYTHAGRIRGTANGILDDRSTYPSPTFVVDNDVPNSVGGTQPVQPAGKVYIPAAVPGGALVFDSIQRKNSTYAYDGKGGIGSTEGGSLGVLPWLFHAGYGVNDPKPFGILNEQFVYLLDGVETFARVAIAQTDLDIRVSRKAGDNFGAGIATGIMFRYVNDTNYCFACTLGTAGPAAAGTRSTQQLIIGQVVAGAVTAWTGNGNACPAAWEVFRVTTKSNGDYAVFCDATMVVNNNNAQHAAGTGAGIAIHGLPPYGVGRFGAGLRLRYRNFTVFANP